MNPSEAEIEARLGELRRRREAIDREIADHLLYLELGRRLRLGGGDPSAARAPLDEPAPPRPPAPNREIRPEPVPVERPGPASTFAVSGGGVSEPPRAHVDGLPPAYPSPAAEPPPAWAPPSSIPARRFGLGGGALLDDPVPPPLSGLAPSGPADRADAGRPHPHPPAGGGPPRAGVPEATPAGAPAGPAVPPATAFSDDPTAARRYGRALVAAACEAIARAGRPLRAGEILPDLTARGFTLPGRDPVAALNTRLWKRAAPGGPLRRLGDATYALAGEGDEDAP